LELSGKKDSNKEKSLNNLSLIYQNQGKHKKAIITIEQALSNKDLKKNNINLYAKLIDNKAYNQLLLRDTTDILQDFSKALYLRDSLNNLSGVVVSKIHLAEYYLINKDTIKSIKNLKEAYELAKIINNNRDILTSLKMLSKIDIENSNIHLVKYLNLNDSLQKEERKIGNKFTRIRFETDEYIEETKYLSKQKIWIISIGIFIISTLSFLYYLRRQKAKNKELIFEKEQQKANEEIYSLLLRHQSDLEEGRLQERNRISEDLHDGVLSKLFGTRMAFGFLDLSGKEKDLKKYNSYLHQLQEIETEIRNISHELKSEILSSEFDFIDILDDLIEKQSKVGEFEYKIKNDDIIYWEEINEKVKINLYHIVLEAVQNITKYANASLVNIHFELIGERIRMTIEDNGVGFNLSKKNKGIGLKNMRSRTQKIAGKFELSSILNKGTKITITIPFKIIDHDKKI
jgi:signal transduction histidine kinase